MENSFIKYHSPTGTYIVQKGAYFEEDLIIEGNLLTGSGVNFWKGLEVSGKLELGKRCTVNRDISAKSAVIGSSCHIKGSIEVNSELMILDNSTIDQAAISKGKMFVRPGCSIGFVRSSEVLELVGKVNVKEIESGTKVIVRSV
ncbi:conserved hypothetical protein [Methanosalsum zhilinae DSM 4017]|uniref:Uncharacterized protein n=1 Tax=Methanosalsum zhilinae (strain DSM 4017 / NBRC 107636 / OCM 62 / WeN5) TaxID=679901 RepID=F7XNW6_METZD|nr:hypothetical protein [Methanosalsum zhilinae]AEH60156.1 conserved hypothetical protein [Methanosalsum zhilinae DSM 4017]